jgi:hypothetical protein
LAESAQPVKEMICRIFAAGDTGKIKLPMKDPFSGGL